MSQPLRVAFLGCGFITGVHSRNLKPLGPLVVASYASRDAAKAAEFCRTHGGAVSFGSYEQAIADPSVDAVVVAVPPKFHLDLTLQALAAGKHVLVEKPAFPSLKDFETVREARDRAGRVVLVGENDHYKPLAVTLRKLVADGVIGEMVFAHFTTLAHRLKSADDWRNDESMAGGDAFFEKRVAACHAFVVAPVGLALQSLRDGREVRKDHLADRSLGEQLPEHDRERLVMIVLAHEYHSARPVPRVDGRAVIVGARKRRLFDEHVLAGGQRSQREIEMKARRYSHDHRVDPRILDGGGIVAVTPRALVPAAVLVGFRAVAARVAANDVGPEALQVAAVNLGDEPAAEKGELKRTRHSLEL